MKKGKETIDLSQLPPVTETITSIIFNFENTDKKLKIIESFYKTPEKELKLISREEIILFAKDQKIYVDPAEGKKPAKGEAPVDHKPITSQELAKAAKLLIEENSGQFRKNKKEFLDNIENLKKQKEESIAFWSSQAEEAKKDPKKKPDKKVLPKPEEIIIPEVKEYDLEYLVVLYNYPLTSEEFAEMEKENIILNNVRLIKEAPDYVPPEEKPTEGEADKKAAQAKKPANAPKDAGKGVTDAQILKYFTEATLINPEFTPENVYKNLNKAKMNFPSDSKMRNCLFDTAEFSFRTLDDPKKTYYNVYQEEFINSMRELNEFLYLFKKWSEMHEFQDVGTPVNDFSLKKILEFIKNNDFQPKDLEHNSVGNILSAYFKSRGALEEEEKRINAERELEKQKREEEEKKKKETEILEEEAKKELEKKEKENKKTSTGKKTVSKEPASKPDEATNTQKEAETEKEKNLEDEIDTQGVNDINQLFDNFCDDIVKEFDNPPLDENFNIDEENIKNEEQKINEDNLNNINNIKNQILEENSKMQSQDIEGENEQEHEQEHEQEEVNAEGEEENVPNMSNEIDSQQLSENIRKQAEDLMEQGNQNDQEQQNENENEENKQQSEEVKNEEEKKDENEDNIEGEEGEDNQQIEKESSQPQNQDQQQMLPNTLNQNFENQNLLNDVDINKNSQENIKEESQQNEAENENNNIQNNENINENLINQNQNQNEEIVPEGENQEIDNHKNIIDENLTENLDYERLIINENDEMMKNSLESKNENNFLFNFEKSLNKSRAIPGIFRPPTLLPMEENLRKAIRAKVYPFLPKDVSIPMYEKYNLIHKFEECMKDQIPDRDFDFSNRIYQENLNQDILTQRIAKLLMLSPEVKTFYNENTDNMLLMLFYNIPKERVFRKYNKSRYLNKPDFDNWIKYFKPVFELKKSKDKIEEEKKEESQQQEGAQQANPNTSQNAQPPQEKEKEGVPTTENNNNAPSHIQEGSIHEGNITAKESMIQGKKAVNPYLKLFQPLDDIFTDPMYVSSDTFIGVVKEKIKYMFPSDNGLFIKKILENGIFSSYSSFVIKDEMLFGIRKDQSKNTEFWYRYDMQGTALSISKNEEGKIFTNFTYTNGLNLQILPNGEITQKVEGKNNYRVITSKASIIEYNTDENNNENKWMNIYYANGNYSQIKDGKIRSINNKGHQIEKDLSSGEINILQKIPVTVQMDIESQTNTMIREDGVIQIKYLDNSCLTIHNDTTKIFTEVPDKNNNFKYMIEHDDYCTINVYVTGESRQFDENFNETIKNLAMKSKDGIIYEIVSPDGNKIYVFKDNLDSIIILIMNIDGSILKVEPSKNEVLIISHSEVAKFGDDKNALDNEIYAEKNAHNAGMYICDFDKGRIYTIDDEQNLFEIYDDGYANCSLHDDPNKVIMEEKQEEEKKEENKDGSLVNDDSKNLNKDQNNNPEENEPEIKENVGTETEQKKLERPPSPDYEKLNEENIEPDKKSKKVAPSNLNQSNLSNNVTLEKKENNLSTSNIKKNNINTNNNQSVSNNAENVEEEKKEEEIIPPPTKNFIIPRLFVIENDNSGYELLSEEQISNYKKIKSDDKLHCKYISQILTDDYTSHSWITKYFSILDGIKETHHIHNIQIPETLNKFCHLPLESEFVNKEIYFYRNLIESKCNYDKEFRLKIKEAIENSSKHFEKKNLEWYFGTNMNKEESKQNFEEHQKLLREILNERQNTDVKFNYDEIKKKSIIKKNYIELLENSSSLFDIKKYVKEKDDKRIREDLNFRVYPLNLRLTPSSEVEAIVNGINVVPQKATNSRTKKELEKKGSLKKKHQPIESSEREVKFYPSYFESEKGLEYLKEHPHQKYVELKEKNKKNINENKDVDNMTKAQNLLDKAREEFEQQRIYGNNNINPNIQFGNDVDVNNKNNSPVVYLNDQNSKFPNSVGVGGTGMNLPPRNTGKKILPSIYKQTQILNKINDQYNIQKAREWVESKNMKYTVDGNIRKQNPLVPHYIKPTFPQAEFNEDYIYIDKLTEPRVKTSSVSNRVYFNAPSVEEIRKSGQHDLLIEAIENRRTPEEMMERLNLMITGELCDPLNKQLKIDPVSLDFGIVCVGKTYQMYLKLRNDDNMTNRVMVRNGNKKNYITIENFVGGKVVPGETKKVKVVLRADEEIVGKYNEILEITTKSFIYKIPVKAYIVKQDEYDEKRCGYLKGRELYTKSYPASDAKHKYDPIKIVLPKIRELEEKEKKKMEGQQGYNGSISGIEGDNNGSIPNEDEKGNDLPQI